MTRPNYNVNKDGDNYKIFLVYTYGKGVRMRYFTGHRVPIVNWDTKKQEPISKGGFPQASEYRAALNKLANYAESVALAYQNENKTLTVEKFKALLRQFQPNGKAESDKVNFWGYFKLFIEQREANRSEYTMETLKVYRTSFKKLEEYQKYRKMKIEFSSFDFNFFASYTDYLQNKAVTKYGNKLSVNYVYKLSSTLITVLKQADLQKVSTELRFQSGWLKVGQKPADNIYLTYDEIDAIEALDLSKDKSMEVVRDLFLIGCDTGLRFSDYGNLGKADFYASDGVECVKVKTQKTEITVHIPLSDRFLELFAKYGKKLPKAISNQKTNQKLKTIGKLAGLTDEVTLESQDNSKKFISLPKYELISTHTARRSFCTNLYSSGLPPEDIMKMTGHKSHQQFMKYLKLTSNEVAKKVANHKHFRNKPKQTQSPA